MLLFTAAMFLVVTMDGLGNNMKPVPVWASIVFKGLREQWRTDRARIVWLLVHAAASAILIGVTNWRGSVIGWAVIAASYGVGYVVLTVRAVRRESSNRQANRGRKPGRCQADDITHGPA